MTDGRGSGRLVRRQKRLEKLRAKEAVAREERQTRKELVKVSCPYSVCPELVCAFHEHKHNLHCKVLLPSLHDLSHAHALLRSSVLPAHKSNLHAAGSIA